MARTRGNSSGAIETSGTDADSNTKNAQVPNAGISGYNGSTWDMIRTGISGAVSSVIGYLNNLPFAQYVSSSPTLTANQFTNLYVTINGFLKVSLGDLLAGEDLTNNVMKVEHQYSYSGVK